ncbi:hypothetical protein F5146DRAFT_1145582 [Armillaria mellea]|nr:hypothetical protein F5146DRAFT_1145582 [Armillaria mellea]
MEAACPTNIRELPTFFPDQPILHSEAKSSTSTADYTARDPPPPQYRFISSRPYLDLLLNLKEFISGLVNDLGIGQVSCQSMQNGLDAMAMVSFRDEKQAIAAAAGLAGRIRVNRVPVAVPEHSQIGDYTFIVGQQQKTEDGHVEFVPAEALTGSFCLDAAQKQTGTKAVIVKLALQMAVADAEFGLFFGGYIVIAAQLVKSADPSRPGLTLLLSPTFKLQSKPLPIPTTEERLTPFQTNIPPEPFLAILIAMLCANLLPGCSVTSPPAAFLEPRLLNAIPDVMEDEEDDDESNRNNDRDTGEDRDKRSSIPAYSLQIRTNAMMLRHPWLNCSDIHHIAFVGHPPRPLSNVQSALAVKGSIPSTKSLLTSPPHLRNLLRASRIPSTNIDTVTLVERIQFVSEHHSEMVLRELYMYDVVLKGCSSSLSFMGRSRGQPVVVGNVKEDLGVVEWKSLVDSVKKLHSSGVMHGDLEPRNVSRTREGTFKFFDFGRLEMHRCRKGGCEEAAVG